MENSTAPKTRLRSPLKVRRHGNSPSERRTHPKSQVRNGLYRAAIKRSIDIIVALLLLVPLLPIMLVVALAVRIDSSGPVLFRQRRLGRDMEPFTVLKFRTMAADSSPELHQRYIAELAGSRENGNGDGEIKKLTADPRVTAVGRILRRVSIDELPQIFNVLGGSMSLIGPRPAIEYELKYYSPLHFKRFDVRPGITGLWQVSGRNRLDFHEMLDLDVQYCEEADLVTDIGILARTPIAAVRHAA